MKIISSIEINNFRSIVKFDKALVPNHLNIIVGQNDIGKSNFLKALNLFFNGETELGNSFRFNDDFSKYAITANKKAEEILIKITFSTPRRFKDNEELVWTKIWRSDGLHKSEIKTKSGKPPSAKGGALQWVNKVKYQYVPAIRGNEYFNYLMGILHDALSEINPYAFNQVSEEFIKGLKSQVQLLVNDISKKLGYSSQIGMPSNFKSLFSTLDFGLYKGGTIVSLNKRGDGIKAQHIPIILKFIANHYKSLAGKAVINPETIWGFEEPENNMEMGNAFKLATIFESFSSDLQIIINTHSPAFYSLAKGNPHNTNLYLVSSPMEKNGTKIENIAVQDIKILDEEVGLLPVISDYIKKEIELRQIAEKKVAELESLKSNTKCLVLTEDADTNICKRIFEMQGFSEANTEFISYESRSNLLAALQSCKITISEKPNLSHIIFHRDSDIYEDDEHDKEKVNARIDDLNKNSSIKYLLFKTKGYDLESYFINADHIHALFPEMSIETIETLINQSTKECEEKSMDKLLNKLEIYRKQYEVDNKLLKFGASKYIKKIESLYYDNIERYRYGKSVLGILTSKMHSHVGNVSLIQNSGKIIIPELRTIASELNLEKI